MNDWLAGWLTTWLDCRRLDKVHWREYLRLNFMQSIEIWFICVVTHKTSVWIIKKSNNKIHTNGHFKKIVVAVIDTKLLSLIACHQLQWQLTHTQAWKKIKSEDKQITPVWQGFSLVHFYMQFAAYLSLSLFFFFLSLFSSLCSFPSCLPSIFDINFNLLLTFLLFYYSRCSRFTMVWSSLLFFGCITTLQ